MGEGGLKISTVDVIYCQPPVPKSLARNSVHSLNSKVRISPIEKRLQIVQHFIWLVKSFSIKDESIFVSMPCMTQTLHIRFTYETMKHCPSKSRFRSTSTPTLQFATKINKIVKSKNCFLLLQTLTSNRHTATKQFDGTVVTHALPYATRFPISSRIQGVVLQSNDWHDRRQHRIQ